MWACTVMPELKAAMWRRAASALGRACEGVGFVEEDLALQVGGLDEVAVDEGERADAGAGEKAGGGGAGGSDSDDSGVSGARVFAGLPGRCRGRGPGGSSARRRRWLGSPASGQVYEWPKW